MKCRGLGEQLSAYLDGELRDEAARAIEGHLASCRPCAEELEALRAVRALVQDKPPVRASPFFYARLAARLRERQGEALWLDFPSVTKRLVPAVAAVTLVIIALSFWPREMEPVALEPYLLDSSSPRLERAVLIGEEGLSSGEVLQWTVMTE